MSDNGYDGERQFPYPVTKSGKGYGAALQSRSTAILSSLQGFLASNYRASIPSPEYATFLRSVATELATLTLTLEALSSDLAFDAVRPEFLYQSFAHFIFRDGDLPDLDLSDEGFRKFLLTIVKIFFQGSTPKSIQDAIELFTSESFVLMENFEQARSPTSTKDISDQFGFEVAFDLSGGFPQDVFSLQDNIELLIRLVKPSHTLYRIAHRFQDLYTAGNDTGLVQDEVSWLLHDRRYQEVRKYCRGMAGWEASTGYIEQTSLFVFRDLEVSSPLQSVAPHTTLHILEGVNEGVYTVLESLSNSEVRISPRFKEAQDLIKYTIEVDRLGSNKEIQVLNEDVSEQFISSVLLQVALDGPYSIASGGTLTANAQSNFVGETTYTWDFTGDNIFTDATGSQASHTYAPGMVPQFVTVQAVTSDGRVKRSREKVTFF